MYYTQWWWCSSIDQIFGKIVHVKIIKEACREKSLVLAALDSDF